MIPGSSKTPTDTHTARVQLPITSSESEELLETGFESDVFARSTMEDALASPAKFPTQSPGDISSDGSRDTSPVRRAEPEILHAAVAHSLKSTSPKPLRFVLRLGIPPLH